MAITAHTLAALMDRLVGLCCQGTDDQSSFRGHLMGVVMENKKALDQYPIDTHDLDSQQMRTRGLFTQGRYRDCVQVFCDNAVFYRRSTPGPAAADSVQALRTGRSFRLPAGEDAYSLQTKTQPGLVALGAAAGAQDVYDDSSSSNEDDGGDFNLAALSTPRDAGRAPGFGNTRPFGHRRRSPPSSTRLATTAREPQTRLNAPPVERAASEARRTVTLPAMLETVAPTVPR